MKDTSQILAEILVGGEPLRIHLIGVAGSGMSGLAGLLLALGHDVSGSDKVDTVEVERLQKLGLKFYRPQAAENLRDADLVIFSSAIRPGNVEYDEAYRLRLNMVRRADALAAIMHGRRGIVVAGMHGKTTTSSMTAHVLRGGGLKPSHYVGAEIPILGTNAHWDPEGEWFVAEGDESDGTLANYHVEYAIILNIEEEHLDYYEDLAAIEAVFNKLMNQTRGTIFYCADDHHARRLCSVRPNTVSYGESEDAAYRFVNLHNADFQSRFEVLRHGVCLGEVVLNVPGRHNVSNALAVIALASELGIPFASIVASLESFRGARRRFEVKYRSPGYLVVDDYAHHPTELKATLATARGCGRQRLITLFQPHRYTRTQKLKDEFGSAFDHSNLVFVSDVYAASEPPIPGVSGQTIVDAMQAHGHQGGRYIPDPQTMILEVGRIVQPGDCVLTLGAGNIHELGSILARDLRTLDALTEVMGEGSVRLYEPLSKHTTMRIGGPAQFWAEPETEEGLARLVAYCHQHDIPLMVIGRGSNLLVRDGGIRGVVVHPARGQFKEISSDGMTITAGAGVKFKEVALKARSVGIGGLEWMEGIPGSVGGGLRMNAGAMGSETFNHVTRLRVVNQRGEILDLTPADLEIHYRNVPTLKTHYVVQAEFQGVPRPPEEIERLLDESMHKRRTTQPRESSAGCIFKNPAAIPAGKLVDELGLKETRSGNARISGVHGNFIVNDGGATARDVLDLIRRVQDEALKARGITLETEVQIVGAEETFLK